MRCNPTIFVFSCLIFAGYIALEEFTQEGIARPISHGVPSVSNFSVYENSSFGLTVRYPSDWKKVEDGRGSWFRNANESVNVRVETLMNISFENFTASQINLTSQQFPGFVLVESNETKIGDNYTAHKIVFTFPQEPSDLQRKKEMKVWTTSGSRAYVISYFAFPDVYDNYLPIVQKIIDSFRMTPIIKK